MVVVELKGISKAIEIEINVVSPNIDAFLVEQLDDFLCIFFTEFLLFLDLSLSDTVDLCGFFDNWLSFWLETFLVNLC